MRLIGLLSFFDEDEKYIEGNLQDLHALGVSKVVAVDGSYARYGGNARSPLSLIEKLYFGTKKLDMGLLLYQPTDPWAGDEVEKRQVMIDLAWSIAEDDDWFVVWDCDYKLISMMNDSNDPQWGREDLRFLLMGGYTDFAIVSFTESSQDNGYHPMQMFIRAQPVEMDGNHHTYRLRDGRRSQILRRPVENMADALDLSEIKVLHRVYQREPERRARQTAYYERRDRDGIER